LPNGSLATLLLDLLTVDEEAEPRNVFDIVPLGQRLAMATTWTRQGSEIGGLAVAYFGVSTGAAVALVAAADECERIAVVVSRGGRPDRAGQVLPVANAPTILIVRSNDHVVRELNRGVLARLRREIQPSVVPGPTHLFGDPVLSKPRSSTLADGSLCILLEIRREIRRSRGGAAAGFEIAKALKAPLDIALVRKIAMPWQPEVALSAVSDGTEPLAFIDREMAKQRTSPERYIEEETAC
jgi:pimeloyl-ACP methyl ester carboxylesterase